MKGDIQGQKSQNRPTEYLWHNSRYHQDDEQWQVDAWGSISIEIYLNGKKIRTNPVSLAVYDDDDWHGPLMVQCDLYLDGDLRTHRWEDSNVWEIFLTSPAHNDFTGENCAQPPNPPGMAGYSRGVRMNRIRYRPWLKIAFDEYTP